MEQLLEKRYSCVIWDEAHKIRRGNLSANNVYKSPEKKSLYIFAELLSARTQTMLLATATPVQLHPMELWDLLAILSVNNSQVLGGPNSFWRLHQRVKAGGFIKTLLQRRVGSSLVAGLKTTRKMLAVRPLEIEDDPDDDAQSIYPLTEVEKGLLKRLEEHLSLHLEREDDPKFERVRDILALEFEGRTWLDRGVLIFSQFYDSAYALAE